MAEDFPDSVEEVTPMVIDRLTDDDPKVRENACWILGYLHAYEAHGPLEERVREDTSQEVRTRATWALSQIECG